MDTPLTPPLTEPARTTPTGYFALTRTATYGFLAALPLFVLYEVLILLVNNGSLNQIRVGADVWIKRVLASMGAGGMLALGLVVIAIGIAIYMVERKKQIPLKPKYFGWMIGESLIYGVVLAFIISSVVGWLFFMAPTVTSPLFFVPQGLDGVGLPTKLALSIGAGLYEELVFRVILVGGMFWGLKQLMNNTNAAYVIAAVVGALIFSWVHYTGSLGDPFTLSSFSFRFLFGLALNALYLVRGFGVAAWTHALYDVLVVTNLLG
ncbi:MAG: CPBP family glutamic-type intramembrane protease [Rhodothermales bacterium]